MKIYKIHLLIFFLVAIFPASVLLLQQSEDLMIVQTDKKIIIDGILDEWSTVKETPVNLFPDGKKLDPSPDLIVTARFTYDSKNFYAAIKAIDDHFEFPNRSWRYGDGLYLTFIDPYEGDESDRFCSFGFSLSAFGNISSEKDISMKKGKSSLSPFFKGTSPFFFAIFA